MMTTTHMLMAAAVTTRPGMKGWLITLGWLGGFAPDASMFAMVGLSRMGMLGTSNLWRHPDGLYWNDPWLSLADYSHSIPIWGALALIGYVLWRGRPGGTIAALGLACLIFGAGAALHSFVDMLVHTDDAHAHFLPLTDWRFHSAVSYYQRDHYGGIVSVFEMLMDAGIAIWLVVKFRLWPVRILAVLFAAVPLMMQFMARMMFHG